MSVKSFAVGDSDMFYIRHGSDNFTSIDCSLSDGNPILREINTGRPDVRQR